METTARTSLGRRLDTRTARVCVVGQGYVGLSLAAAAAVEGFHVTGIDVDAERVAALAGGELVVPGVEEALFVQAAESGRLGFGSDYDPVATADVVVICVPTPVHEHRPDLSMVESAGRAVGERLRRGALVILESTTYPGTTEQVLRPLLERPRFRAGQQFWLAFSPERIDPGNVKYGLRTTPRVVGGIDEASTELAAAFYSTVVDDVNPVSGCRTAEMAKLLENTFRMVNIALVNELSALCAEQGIDTWEVIEAAATKPFGFMPFHPGPGVGGHCIPLDPTYLAWQSRRDTGRPFRLVELAQDINAEMPAYVARRIGDALGDRGVPLPRAEVMALGVTYKPDVGDLRESAAVKTLEMLAAKGARIRYHDPFVPRLQTDVLRLRRTPLTAANLEAADAVVVLTPHSQYDLDALTRRAGFVFDARNALRRRGDDRVVTL
ncbi:nucleotide sugar dehydrogenase [Nocardioides sp. GXQ0305]|uniref:nucleotide sugar dehydrogenase n=1 Tax=Nocardioides sp. GXQ0305 TaxID=3423912 RepID=UPI003D7D99F1